MVAATIATFSALAILNLRSALHDVQVNSVHQTTLALMRQARQSAVAERRVYVVTFTAPATVLVQRREQNGTLTEVNQNPLSFDMRFWAEPGIPTANSQTPDNFGTGSIAVDLNGSNQICFQPDGSVRDSAGRVANGVIYLARPGDLSSARAISLFGTTGRIKGWRLSPLAWRWI